MLCYDHDRLTSPLYKTNTNIQRKSFLSIYAYEHTGMAIGFKADDVAGANESKGLEKTQRRKRVLLSTESAFASNFLPPLIRSPDIELRLITDEESSAISTGATKVPHYMDSVDSHTFDNRTGSRRWLRAKAAELCEWADLLIVAPIDAGTLGSMLYGLTHTLTLSLLRGWDSYRSWDTTGRGLCGYRLCYGTILDRKN